MAEQNGEERTITLDPDTQGEYLTTLDRRAERLYDKAMNTEVAKTHPAFKEELSRILNQVAEVWCYHGILSATDKVTDSELCVLDLFVKEEEKEAN